MRRPWLFVVVACLLAGPASATTTGNLYFLPRRESFRPLGPPSSQVGDGFGAALDLGGDTLVVGAPGSGAGTGAAYVYVRSGVSFALQATLDGGAVAGDGFGASVAVDGDTVVVGAPGRDGTAGADQGAVLVFTRSASTWSAPAVVQAADGVAGDRFGTAVALDGGTLVAGAPGRDVAGADAGVAYVLVGGGTTWTVEATLVGSQAMAGDLLGAAVAVDGDLAIAGGPGHDGAGADSGTAWIFARTGATWSEEARLEPPTVDVGERFGHAVDVQGDTAVVGAPKQVANNEAGAAYVYRRAGSAWSEETRVRDGSLFGNRLGASVRLDGDRLLAGEPADTGFDDVAGTDNGSACLLARSGTHWAGVSRLDQDLPIDGSFETRIGGAVAMQGNTIVLGAPSAGRGTAWVFTSNPPAFSEAAQATPAAARILFPIAFTAAAVDPDGDAVTYGWSFGDGGAAEGRQVAHRYVAPGTYDVRVTASDGIAVATSATTVTVAPVTGGVAAVTLRERYVHQPKRVRDDDDGGGDDEGGNGEGPSFVTEEVEDGTVAMKGTLDLAGLDPAALTADSTFALALGRFLLAVRLGDAPAWRPGKSKARILVRIDVSDDQPELVTFMTVRLKWQGTLLRWKLAGITVRNDSAYFTPVVADTFVGLPSGTQAGTVTGAVAFDGATAALERAFTAAVKTTIRIHHDPEEGDSELLTSAVRVTGKTSRRAR